MQRLDPPLPLRTPFGDAHALFVTDRGKGHHLEWTCAIDEGPHAGEIWTLPNPHVRRQTSITDQWLTVSPFGPEVYATYPVQSPAEAAKNDATSVVGEKAA